ncbi:DUF5880 domain-containing protein [Plasmodiophora brassicae]|uniref:DUF5880 domain-containing protein n=1 Tax=Plasmodiophora brassicae TaxID=37360 RepID=A0A0G4IIF3_PLABS|nr:hypothetical protein PBRA_003673 [Plasmodiophora brassicae]
MSSSDVAKSMSMTGTELNASTIASVMSMEGPTVTAVLLKPDGAVEQVSVDTTPKVNAAATLLNGNPTFVGQWPQINVVIMCSKVRDDDWAQNTHKLQVPFSKSVVYGNILLLRMDDHARPSNFTKEEWERFSSESIDAVEIDEEEETGPIQSLKSDLEKIGEESAELMEEDDEEDKDFDAEEDDAEEDDDEDEDDEEDDEERPEDDIAMDEVDPETLKSTTRSTRSSAAKAKGEERA